jgi:hypothetical protein
MSQINSASPRSISAASTIILSLGIFSFLLGISHGHEMVPWDLIFVLMLPVCLFLRRGLVRGQVWAWYGALAFTLFVFGYLGWSVFELSTDPDQERAYLLCPLAVALLAAVGFLFLLQRDARPGNR